MDLSDAGFKYNFISTRDSHFIAENADNNNMPLIINADNNLILVINYLFSKYYYPFNIH